MKNVFLSAATLFALSLVAVRPASADEWNLALGASAFHGPTYRGSESMTTRGFPSIQASRGNFFFNMRNGFGYNLVKSKPWRASVALGWARGRDGNSIEHLDDVADIDHAVNGKINIRYRIIFVSLGLSLRRRVTGDDTGTNINFAVNSGFPLSKQFLLTGGFRATYGDDDYVDTWFGIDQQQARRSSTEQYDPGAGVVSTGINLMGIYSLTERWKLNLFTNYNQLQGDAADSPLIRQDYGTSYGIAISYQLLGEARRGPP